MSDKDGAILGRSAVWLHPRTEDVDSLRVNIVCGVTLSQFGNTLTRAYVHNKRNTSRTANTGLFPKYQRSQKACASKGETRPDTMTQKVLRKAK